MRWLDALGLFLASSSAVFFTYFPLLDVCSTMEKEVLAHIHQVVGLMVLRFLYCEILYDYGCLKNHLVVSPNGLADVIAAASVLVYALPSMI